MLPTASKIEIFARNNNLRKGWLSIGNQLGINYEKWKNVIDCDLCSNTIKTGEKRFKSRIAANVDICELCYNAHYLMNEENPVTRAGDVNHRG